MKGDAQVIGHLQAQLKNELTAINQYFLHYRMLKHWGFDKLAKKEYSESIGEMKHADWLMDRIFTLDGLPNLQDLAKIQVGEDVPEILACDLRAEQGAQATIKDGIAHCESVRDYVSRDLLQKILDDTEEHIDFLETQIDLIGKVGLQNYLQSQMGDAMCLPANVMAVLITDATERKLIEGLGAVDTGVGAVQETRYGLKNQNALRPVFLCLRAAAWKIFLPDSNAPCDHGLLQVHINGRKFPQHKCECFSTKVEYQPTTSGRVQ